MNVYEVGEEMRKAQNRYWALRRDTRSTPDQRQAALREALHLEALFDAEIDLWRRNGRPRPVQAGLF